MWVCTEKSVVVCVCVCMCMYVCIYVHIYIYICIYISELYVYVYMCECVCVMVCRFVFCKLDLCMVLFVVWFGFRLYIVLCCMLFFVLVYFGLGAFIFSCIFVCIKRCVSRYDKWVGAIVDAGWLYEGIYDVVIVCVYGGVNIGSFPVIICCNLWYVYSLCLWWVKYWVIPCDHNL